MKIGISASLVHGGRSGIGQYVIQLLGALLRACPHHEYVVFARQDDWPVFSFAQDAVRVEPIGGWRDLVPDDVRWHQLTLPRIARELRLDVLHVPTQRRMPWRKPCATVTTVHDVGPFRSPRCRDSRGSCPSGIFRTLARRQDVLITPTHAAANELAAQCALPRERVAVVPVGVDPERFQAAGHAAATNAILRRYQLHPPFFLCVGRLEPRTHNQVCVIEAFSRFKTRVPSPWQLVLIGDEGARAGEIHAYAERSPFGADIRVLEYVAAEELPAWYRAAGAVISMRRRDGFAHGLVEAMACGTPLVAVESPATREVCGDAALYCEPDSPPALEARLMLLALDEALRRSLAAAGPPRAAALSWSRAAAATAEAYMRAQQRFCTLREISSATSDIAAAS